MTTRSSLPKLVELIVRNPFVTVARVQRALGMTNQGARNLIRDAEGRGWLRQMGTRGRGGRAYWLAPAVFDAIEAPAIHQ